MAFNPSRASRTSRRGGRRRRRGPGALRIALALLAVLVIAGAGGALAFYLTFMRDLPELHSVADYQPSLASRVYDRHGRAIGEFFTERRRLTPFEIIPEHVVQAFVAGEDSAFFEHSGIDFESILRAAWVNLLAGGEIKQGGSTITQQMVKGLLLTPERKLRRKIREMLLARQIEERFSKPEILYLYLNQIYFGHGAYGIGEAAEIYFGKDVSELSISEGAQLAGLPKAPSRYSPHVNPDQAEKRRLYVLERMLADGFIDESAHAAARAERPELVDDDEAYVEAAAYFTEEVRRYLFDQLGSEEVLRGGLVIETTLDRDLQRTAVEALRRGLVDLEKRQGYRGPLRRVAPTEIPSELARLGEENGLVDEESEGEEAEPTPPTAAASLVAALDPDQTLLGVITAVDVEAKLARVGFSPDFEGVVRLKDVSWAREPDPKKAPRAVKSIDRIFAEGDVATFKPLPQDENSTEPALREVPLFSLFQEPQVQGALLSIDIRSDEVIALVGGYDFSKSQFNRVTQARRQPGSAFKPIIYAAALAKGYTPASILYDRPVVYVDEESGFTWRPRNYGRSFYGPITMREALSRSVNNATVHLFRDVGVDYVIAYARRLGIQSPLNRDLSLALGSSDVSLLELTRAYAVFPAGGREVRPRFIRRVTNRYGDVLLENVELDDADDTPDVAASGDDLTASLADPLAGGDGEADVNTNGAPKTTQILPPEEAYLVSDLLRAVVADAEGTGWRARALRRPLGGKTGTTNDQGDAWFIGFSPDVVTGAWVGHDESRFLGWGETGSRAAAPIWVEFMQAALADTSRRDFPVPEPIVFARIDRKTGLLADATSKNTVFQAFLADTEPKKSASVQRTTSKGRRLLRMDDF